MRSREVCTMGLLRLAVAFDRELSKARIAAYFDAFAGVEDAVFEAAIPYVVETWRPSYYEPFPLPATLLGYMRPHQNFEALAARAFANVCYAGSYTPHGTVWVFPVVRRDCGSVAAEAFVAAGGPAAFAREQGPEHLPFLRKRFVEAYLVAVAAESRGQPLLESGQADPRLRALTAGIGNGPVP